MRTDIGKFLIVVGLTLIVFGLFLHSKLKFGWIGHLPGDINIKRDNFQFYFPLTTCLLISALVTVFFRIFRK